MEETTFDGVSEKVIFKVVLNDIEWARIAQSEGKHNA